MSNSAQQETCQVHSAPTKSANRMLLLMVAASLVLIVWHVIAYGPTAHGVAKAATGSLAAQVGREIWDLLTNPRGILPELWEVFPYFIIGVLLGGYIRTYKIAVKMQAKLRRYGIASVFLASLVGILTPLCACGTLTTAISLLFAGLPLAPVMALLVTSPLMSPSTYLITLNDLGPEWTVIRTIAAFSMGIFAGLITHFLKDRGFKTKEVFIEGAIPRGDFHDEAYPDERLRCNCKEKFGNRVAARTQNKFYIFLAKSSEMLWLVGKYVLVGVVIGAIVERYMPYEWIYKLFGRRDPLNIVWITLGSVPIFLHQLSASSILYHIKSSLHGTLDSGAGLAFMIGGPVTAVPTMVLFWTVFKKRVFALYLFVCIVGTILISYAFQVFVFVPHVDTGNALLKDVGSLSGGASAIITKQDQNVRIVMDPDGNSVIATASNDISGQGNIVFDGSVRRLQEDKYDNKKYIVNIAQWLEQTNDSANRNSILIYGSDAAVGLNKNMIANLEKNGFAVTVVQKAETPRIAQKTLERFSQVWFVFGADPGSFSTDEAAAVAQFVKSGRSMLVATDAAGEAAANQISGQYGVVFSGAVETKEELPATTAEYFFQRTSRLLGSILKLVHKA
jgi:uncharacterized membrane protein YraQ (UPF0718 family)